MNTDSFALRHIGPREADLPEMLKTIGVDTIDQLIYETVPDDIILKKEMNLPRALSEQEYLAHIGELANKNKVFKTYIGLGYHNTIMPPVIQRNILENPGWYTPYTPYQAEIAQGRLEALLNFQTLVSDLTAMDVANASLLDEATAAAEAMTLLRRVTKKPATSRRFLVVGEVFPQTWDVLVSRAEPLDIHVERVASLDAVPEDAYGVLVQYPDGNGEVRNLAPLVDAAHAAGALVAVAADLLALTLLTPPGELGADV